MALQYRFNRGHTEYTRIAAVKQLIANKGLDLEAYPHSFDTSTSDPWDRTERRRSWLGHMPLRSEIRACSWWPLNHLSNQRYKHVVKSGYTVVESGYKSGYT